jgi:hypothetical protein
VFNGYVDTVNAATGKPEQPYLVTVRAYRDRFIEEADVLGSLDPRQNLMELSHAEFETFIMNLFAMMGLKTHLTRSSNDRGVDGVAIDSDPITGGKVVIQAKRYKGLVPAAAVRELYGTMITEGASNGILVTTSWYGSKAREWAEGKPLKLWDRQNLLHLLQEYCGIEAKVVPPEHWSDPTQTPTASRITTRTTEVVAFPARNRRVVGANSTSGSTQVPRISFTTLTYCEMTFCHGWNITVGRLVDARRTRTSGHPRTRHRGLRPTGSK